MCILFIYTNTNKDSDYSLILASNRDEYYDRPALRIAPWEDDPNVYGGIDIQGGGTWLAVSPNRKKLGVILNIPGQMVDNARSRGDLVAEFVKSNKNTEDYIASLESHMKDYNGFLLATAEWETTPVVKAYCNVENNLVTYGEGCISFGNSVLSKALTKAKAGQEQFRDICSKFNNIEKKEQLVEELLLFLKSEEKHLPDHELEERQPLLYKEFSSIFVRLPDVRYGTRTHTLVMVTKSGNIEIIEVNLVAPIDPLNPKWEVAKYQFDL